MTEVKSGSAQAASDVDIVALKPGARIGRHEVLAVLGQGGFGITYRARDSQLNREVAIKEYLPTSLAYRADGTTVMPRSTKVAEDFTWGRDRFVAEGQTLASLHHAPGIVRVFDFLEINGTAYIVMEMLRGDTLEARVKSGGPLDGAAVERILWTLLDGLEQVHAAGFLHRDIKPANILLDGRGNPTLIDFGASRAAMAGRTTAMTAIFTPGYAAAEQMTSAKQGPWTDIYGLSATLYHAITGKAPPNAFDRMLDDEYEPLASLAPPGLAPGLIAGIDAGLAVRASDRPQSIAGWRLVLSMASPAAADATQVVSRTIDPAATVVSRTPTVQPTRHPTVQPTGQPSPPSDAAAASPAPARDKSKVPLYAGLAAAIALLAGGGGYFALAPSKPAPAPVTASAPQAVILQDLKVEDLERVLAERRAADAAAAEKKRLEEEAQRKAEADSAAKLAADADLAKAEAARRKAEEELAKLKAEIEARRLEAQNEARRAEAEAAQRKAEAEMAALKQAEDDARRKAAAEAEAKRLADEALAKAQAERQKADEAARAKAAAEAREKAEATSKQIAEAEAKAKAEVESEAARKAAEAAEAGLRLAAPDRQRIQVALSSLGFDTRGTDGALGPRSREMIVAWQKARNQPATGFLDGTQHQALLREAAPALQRYDDEQKKKEEEAKAATQFDGTYGGAFNTPFGVRPVTVRVSGTTATGSFVNQTCGTGTFTLSIAAGGTVSGSGSGFDANCGRLPLAFRGQIGNGRLQLTLSAPTVANLSTTLALGATPPPATTIPAAAAPPVAPVPAPPSSPAPAGTAQYDGRWSGTVNIAAGGQQALSVTLRNGTGSGTWRNSRCGGDVTFTVTIQGDGAFTVAFEGYNQSCQRGTSRHSGTVQGNTVSFIFGPGNTFSLKR